MNKRNEIVYKMDQLIKMDGGEKITLKEIWQPGEFKSDFYKVAATLKKGERILDRAENGFVVINEDILENGPFPVESRCHHCNTTYVFNRKEIRKIYGKRFPNNWY